MYWPDLDDFEGRLFSRGHSCASNQQVNQRTTYLRLRKYIRFDEGGRLISLQQLGLSPCHFCSSQHPKLKHKKFKNIKTYTIDLKKIKLIQKLENKYTNMENNLGDLPQPEIEAFEPAQFLSRLSDQAFLECGQSQVRIACFERLDTPQVELCLHQLSDVQRQARDRDTDISPPHDELNHLPIKSHTIDVK